MQTGIKGGRLQGALRYGLLRMGKPLLFVLALLLIADVVGFLLGLAGVVSCETDGVRPDWVLAGFMALVFARVMTKGGATFLCRFGVSRFSLWLGMLLSLLAGAAATALGTLAESAIEGYSILALSGSSASFQVVGAGYASGEECLRATLLASLREMPQGLTSLFQWTCLFFLLACCLRRNRWLTLGVLLLGPLLLWALSLAPALRQLMEAAQSGEETELLLMGMRLMTWLQRAEEFLEERWTLVSWLGTLVCLPLSYLCVRGTPQP